MNHRQLYWITLDYPSEIITYLGTENASHLKLKAGEITEGPIFGLIFCKKEQPVAAAI